jgi:hypothetical protein
LQRRRSAPRAVIESDRQRPDVVSDERHSRQGDLDRHFMTADGVFDLFLFPFV